MAGADTIERLRQYLRELSPPARSLLIGELERSLLGGEEVAGTDLVLHELRRVVREQREGAPRIGNSARLFFKPLEPFLVDDRGDHKHPGRIARCALEMLWTWIRRDLLPEDAKILAEEVSDALFTGDEPKAEHITRAFQDHAVAALEASFESAASDEQIRRHMLAQVGTQRPSEDATTLICVLKGRDALATLAAHLPLRIGNLANGLLDECKALIESTAGRDGDLFLYALLVVMSRLAAPWQLIRLGTKAAGSDTAARVAETQYGVAVSIVLAELERMVGELRNDLRSGRGVAVGALLKTIHDSARGLRTELDLPVDSTWGRALAAQRAQVADLLRSEIESMPGRVHRLLRPRPSTEIRPHSALDLDDVAETEALVEFVGACRHFASDLAINEMTQRTFSELQQYLDSGTGALLDGLRHAGTADRSFRQSQLDAAVHLCAKVFGQEYASLLGKAAEVASAAERKAAGA
ncbi:MAG TPA: hypothetical protein VII24_03570 [Pseudolabrys sp.]